MRHFDLSPLYRSTIGFDRLARLLDANTTVDPTGFGEGEIYLGSVDVVTDGSGDATFSATFADGTTMQSGGRSSPAPEPIERTNIGAPPDGYSIVFGSGYVTETYRATISAFGPGGSSAELESKYSKMQSAGSYR